MEQIDSATGRTAFSAGLFLGENKGKDFLPSVALLDMLGKDTDRWVVVDDKAEWLFLCGRDVFGKSVVEANVTSGLAIVKSKRGEVLGYGKIKGHLDRKEQVFLQNLLDRGDFLRREMGKKK